MALVLGACSSTPDDDLAVLESTSESVNSDEESSTSSSSTTSSSTTTSTTATSTTVEQPDAIPTAEDGEAFDEYIARRVEAFFEVSSQARFEPSADPLSDYPELAELSADSQLTAMTDAIKDWHAQGRADREPEEPAVGTTTDEEHRVSGVITNEGDLVTVFDCEVMDDDTINVETGAVEIAGVLTILSVMTLEKIEGDWKVTYSEVTQKIRGVDGCYLASEAEFPY
jgi:hypothetical protein